MLGQLIKLILEDVDVGRREVGRADGNGLLAVVELVHDRRSEAVLGIHLHDGVDLATDVDDIGVTGAEDVEQTMFEQSRGEELRIEFGFSGRSREDGASAGCPPPSPPPETVPVDSDHRTRIWMASRESLAIATIVTVRRSRLGWAGGIAGGLGVALAAALDAVGGIVVAAAAAAAIAARRGLLGARRAVLLAAVVVAVAAASVTLRASAVSAFLEFLGVTTASTQTNENVQSYSHRTLLGYIGLRSGSTIRWPAPAGRNRTSRPRSRSTWPRHTVASRTSLRPRSPRRRTAGAFRTGSSRRSPISALSASPCSRSSSPSRYASRFASRSAPTASSGTAPSWRSPR